MSEANRAPSQNGGKTGDSLHPGEGAVFGVGSCEESEETESGGDDNGKKGAALPVDVGEEAGGLALICKGGQSSRGAVNGRVANGEDSDHDDDIHDRVKSCNSSIVYGNDEGGGLGVRSGLAYKVGVVIGD